ncbi:pirin family protein [Thiohalorhabdus sp. Cl-TMA]|uniref:Pirin family protein n=1 Tax=Thiohalorhabdus methylotrophus TaxID=3242694 RepID=A0ABV4TRW1_9GAMM
MAEQRAVAQVVPATAVSEGAGVRILRTIGTPARRHLDPFLMLDHFGTDNPDDYGAGFPDHPHRGFITLTYMLDGHMAHGDSMGNEGRLDPGGAQWMKAGSGVIHSEMPRQEAGLMRGFQLWINLPAAEKMSAPEYQEIRPEAVPEVAEEGVVIRVLAGRYGETAGPVEDPNTDVSYLDVRLEPGSTFTHQPPDGHAAFAFLFEGSARVAGQDVPDTSLIVLGEEGAVTVNAGPEGARLLLVAGRPIGEPIAQYGPFVMTNREELEQAFRDYRDGNLVRDRAAFREI